MKRKDIYSRVNTIIKDKLSAGSLPWRKSWNAAKPPQNFFSKHCYQGINFLLLSCFDFPSPFYLTFLQCKERNAFVNKGEKGIPVVFWKLLDNTKIKESSKTEIEKIPFMRMTTVFNLSQTSLFNPSAIDDLQLPDAENFIKSIPAQIKNNIRANCAFNVKKDFITIPIISEFETPDEYYSTLFHELIHWTGHESRLNRFQTADHNSDNYSKEELTAEIGAAYLCSHFGINNTLDNSAAYIKGWLQKLEEDQSIFVSASTQAKNAVNYLLDRYTPTN